MAGRSGNEVLVVGFSHIGAVKKKDAPLIFSQLCMGISKLPWYSQHHICFKLVPNFKIEVSSIVQPHMGLPRTRKGHRSSPSKGVG